MEDNQKNQNGRANSIQFKTKIVQIGCGSAPGNLVFKYYLQEKSSEKNFRKYIQEKSFRNYLQEKSSEKS